MILNEKTFYVIKFNNIENLKDFYGIDDVSGNFEIIIFTMQKEKLNSEYDKSLFIREATELEKEYWLDSMQMVDNISTENFNAVSLCEFDEWLDKKR